MQTQIKKSSKQLKIHKKIIFIFLIFLSGCNNRSNIQLKTYEEIRSELKEEEKLPSEKIVLDPLEDKIEKSKKDPNMIIIDKCLKEEFNDPFTKCIYTKTVLTAFQKKFSKIPLRDVNSEEMKLLARNCIIKDSDQCFINVLSYVFNIKLNFFEILLKKLPREKLGSTDINVKLLFLYDLGVLSDGVSYIKCISKYFNKKNPFIVDIELVFKILLEHCHPTNISALEDSLECLRKNQINGEVDKEKFDNIILPLMNFLQSKAKD